MSASPPPYTPVDESLRNLNLGVGSSRRVSALGSGIHKIIVGIDFGTTYTGTT